MSSTAASNPPWTWICPPLAWAILAAAFVYPGTGLLAVLAAVALAGAVFSAVHHSPHR
jgi:Ca2+:H+ antiporter